MKPTQPSMAELIRTRRRSAFVGRQGEIGLFRQNFALPPEDDRHRFLFHIHGDAGVGKTFLVREMEQLAREQGALTAYVDESVGSVPEAMAALCARFAQQGHSFKHVERLLATYRQRRHEAVSTLAEPAQEAGPSAGGLLAAQASLAGLGMLPVVGALAGAMDPAGLAAGADRLRATLSARFRSQDDVQLVLAPERVLTPVLLEELAEAADQAPWIALFFDTYERTGAFLDPWLREVMTTELHGPLSARVVVTLAGQRPFDTATWGAGADFVADLPLAPFTDAEARGLLAAKGITDEGVVHEILRLSGRLPVLVSTLAENQPADTGDVGDPSATAVERFLKWERDPVRRATALACAVPRRLDRDVFRAAAPEAAVPGTETDLFDWLRGLPFVSDRGTRVQYHDMVRAPMLRLQRHESRRDFAARHARLAEAFGTWRREAEEGVDPEEVWEREAWREQRVEEMYHLLCARPVAALSTVLRDVVCACRAGAVVARRWARMVADAGEVTDEAVRKWGREVREALGEDAGAGDTDQVTAALDVLLARPGPGLDVGGRALAYEVRGRELRKARKYARALADYDQAVMLDPGLVRGYYGRAHVRRLQGEYEAALADLDRAEALSPHTSWIIATRGDTHRLSGRFAEAIEQLDRALALEPDNADSLACRGVCRAALGQRETALADLDRALALDDGFLWALVRRARLRGRGGEWDAAFADLDRAVELAPDSAWIASERGDAYRLANRYTDAVAELTRALDLAPEHASALAGRGAAYESLGRYDQALSDFDHAVELNPDYAWALVRRAYLRQELGDGEGACHDLDRAVAARPGELRVLRARAYRNRQAGRLAAALTDLDRVLDAAPDDMFALTKRGAIHRRQRLYRQALRDLDRALTIDPGSAEAHAERIQTCLAMGRTGQVRADLDRLAVIEPGAFGDYYAAWLLLLDGRGAQALLRLDGREGVEIDLLRAEAHRMAGQWDLARRCAARVYADEKLWGASFMAQVVSASEGVSVAAAHWRRARALVAAGHDADHDDLAEIGYALGDWAAADAHLGEFLSAGRDWHILRDLANALRTLARSPGADLIRLTPRLTHVTRACDAVQRRYATDVGE